MRLITQRRSSQIPATVDKKMVSLHILSDLHMEFAPYSAPEVVADVTIVAGDIFTKGRASPWADAQQFFGSPVISVPGNHEFYGSTIDHGLLKLRASAAECGLHLLENGEFIMNGIRFLGCTLWSDFQLFAGDDIQKTKQHASVVVGDRYSARMMDFWSIRVAAEGYRKFRPKDAANLHAQSVSWLEERLADDFRGPTVVITHHAPSALCLPDTLRTDVFSAAYASNLDWLIERYQPALWISGHIHQSVPSFKIGSTQMISNPCGYRPQDVNPRFNPTLIHEVNHPLHQPRPASPLSLPSKGFL